jgi:hypothetical protein
MAIDKQGGDNPLAADDQTEAEDESLPKAS